MTAPWYDRLGVTVHHGDCLDVLRQLPDTSVDAVCTDPPYELAFMGKQWDSTGIAFQAELWRQCLRVLKPGGHLVAFGAPRTYHRLAVAIEDAGFQIRDSLHWIYGSGMPKGQDIAKSIDHRRDDREKVLQVTAWLAAARNAAGWTNRQIDDLMGYNGMAGLWTTQGKAALVPNPEQWAQLRSHLGFDDTDIWPLVEELNARKGQIGEAWSERETIGQGYRIRRESNVQLAPLSGGAYDLTAPATDAAKRWQGWNTSLKPAHEPIVLARKSTGFDSTVANVVMHGTGALNIDACRIASSGTGRWPSNVVLSHAATPDGTDACTNGCAPGCPVAEVDQQSGMLTSGANPTRRSSDKFRDAYGEFKGQAQCSPARGADSGGASRFFPAFRYQAKAPSAERPTVDGVAHPTVKPLALMRWLVRLVTPMGGVVLDPFLGSGTTAQAARAEGFRCIGIENEERYLPLIGARLDGEVMPDSVSTAAVQEGLFELDGGAA